MMPPRWRKILADFLGNPTRSLLVILSIAVGLFAVGSITNTRLQSARLMRENYAATNPAKSPTTPPPNATTNELRSNRAPANRS